MVQEVTTRSWGSRLLGSLLGILIGIALIIGAFVLVFWNESHGLHKAQSLKQTLEAVMTVPTSPINKQNNLKVVYFSGQATTTEILEDPLLVISSKAIRLDRKVEMYQWQQHEETTTEKQMGGSEKTTKTYTYNPVWSTSVIDSNKFKDPKGHENPGEMPFQSMQQQATKVTVGDFVLPVALIDQISSSTVFDPTTIDTTKLADETELNISTSNNSLYLGENPQSPQVGDMRITVTQVLPQVVSVIAQQTGNTLQAFVPRAGQPTELLVSGEVSASDMIHKAEVENQIMTWVLRGVSFLLMVFGISLILGPLVVLADVVPFMGRIVGFGTGVIAFLGGLILWAVATSIAWFVVRPLFAVGLILIVIVICYLIIQRRKNQVSTVAKS